MEVKVSKEEILHIANLASLNIKEEEIEKYRENLQEILQFAEVVNQVNVEELAETIGEENLMHLEKTKSKISKTKKE